MQRAGTWVRVYGKPLQRNFFQQFKNLDFFLICIEVNLGFFS